MGEPSRRAVHETRDEPYQETLPVRLPGIVLGIGLGGFFDGIVLHQVLQWHHMLSSIYSVNNLRGLQINTLADGLFHVGSWIAVLIGLAILYSRVTRPWRRVWGSRVLWGWILVGSGLFNLVEGLIDHEILGVHHVRYGPNMFLWDVGFLVIGIVLAAVGWIVQRSGKVISTSVTT